MIREIKKNLAELGFHEKEIDVYVALTELGESTAATIAKKINLPRTTVISILNKLTEENYFSTHHYRGKNYYWIETPKTIEGILAGKLSIAKQLSEMLTELYRSDAKFPFAQVYDTKKSINSFIQKTLLNLKPKSVIYTIDTPSVGNYNKVMGDGAREMMTDIKRKKSVVTNTLVPFGAFSSINVDKLIRQNITIREMPRDLSDFGASFWIIDGKIVFFSGTPPFLVAIYHPLINKSLEIIYRFLWGLSKSV